MSEFKTFYTINCPELGKSAVTEQVYESMEHASVAAQALARESMLTVFVCRAMQMFETEVKVKLSTGK